MTRVLQENRKLSLCIQLSGVFVPFPRVYYKSARNSALAEMLGYCFTPYQRLWLYNGAPLVAFYDTLGIRRTYSRLKPPASPRGWLKCNSIKYFMPSSASMVWAEYNWSRGQADLKSTLRVARPSDSRKESSEIKVNMNLVLGRFKPKLTVQYVEFLCNFCVL